MKIKPGQPAPGFSAVDQHSNPVNLEDYRGRKLLLSFFRHAACPFSRLRILRLIERHSIHKAWGLEVLGFFQSPSESIEQYVMPLHPPFPLVADPQRVVYRLYGVKASTLGRYKSLLRLGARKDALAAGLKSGKAEGLKGLLPADFLIDEDLMVRSAFHGSDITQHMHLDMIDQFLHGDAEPEG